MTITQTIDILASRRVMLEVPHEVPTGRTTITFTPADKPTVSEIVSTDEALTSARGILAKHLPAFEALAK